MRKLTARQKKYSKARADGATYAEAYERAGYGAGTSKDGKRKNAFRLENESASAEKIQAEIKRLQAQAEAGAILGRKARQALLTEFFLDETKSDTDRLRASDQLARMSGDYTDKVLTENTVKLSYTDRLEAMRQAQKEDDA